MGSYGGTSKGLAVYLKWELEGLNGNPLDIDGRAKAFEAWVDRMSIKNLKWQQSDAAEWVQNGAPYGLWWESFLVALPFPLALHRPTATPAAALGQEKIDPIHVDIDIQRHV